MKVRELIAALQAFDPDLEVYNVCEDPYYTGPVAGAERGDEVELGAYDWEDFSRNGTRGNKDPGVMRHFPGGKEPAEEGEKLLTSAPEIARRPCVLIKVDNN